MTVEARAHLGPHEVEIDTPLYGVILVGSGQPLMTIKLFDSKQKALDHAATFGVHGFAVKINGTHS